VSLLAGEFTVGEEPVQAMRDVGIAPSANSLLEDTSHESVPRLSTRLGRAIDG